MELVYRSVESTEKPLSVEFNFNNVYLRKDIIENQETGLWNYQEAKLTREKFDTYINEIAAINTLNGVDNSNNQLVIMEAIADLYEMIVSKL